MNDPQPEPRVESPAAPDSGPSPEPEEPEVPATPVEPEADLAALRERITELEDQSLRTLADLDNLRKRHARELSLAREEERTRVAGAWLPVLDTLDLALTHADADPASIVSGVAAVREQALQVLNQLGYPRRDDEGALFDPAWHEAVAVVADDDRPAGTVVQVVRPGYGDAARQLRPAAVVVAREDE